MAEARILSNSGIRSFWSLVEIGGPADCWLWQGNCGSGGYGRFRIGSDKVGAHRIALLLEGPPEPPPPNNHALHGDTCISRRCVNPRHLRWGSNLENIADKVRLGRSPRGEGSRLSRLTEEAVRHIRNSNETGVMLAARLGVSTATISMVRNRKVWAHVP